MTAFYLLVLSILILFRAHSSHLKRMALITLVLVLIQFTLGILNVVYLLPIQVAVAHNGIAALLLAHVFCMLHFIREGEVYA